MDNGKSSNADSANNGNMIFRLFSFFSRLFLGTSKEGDSSERSTDAPRGSEKKNGNFWQKVFSKNEGEQTSNDNLNSETEQEREIRKGKEGLDKFLDEFKSQTSLNVDADKLANAIHSFQFYEATLFEVEGYNDGLIGVKNNKIESSAQVKAEFIFEQTDSMLEGRYHGNEAEIKFMTEKIESVGNRINDELEFNVEINALDKEEHRHFSRPIAVFYIIVGIVLMFADFPISVSISKSFIDVPLGFEELDFWVKIQNPEVLLFSLGVTFLSVYYKMMYDEYINVGIIRKNKSGGKETTMNFVQRIIRTVAKLSILVFLFFALWNIGNMRNALGVDIQSNFPDFASKKDLFDYRLFSLVGLTIMLPLLSGISLSIGLAIISNINNLSKSNSRVKRLEAEKVLLEEINTKKVVLKNMLDSLLKEWGNTNKKQKIDGMKALFQNHYYKGYKRGYRIKFGSDIYDVAHSLYVDQLN